MKVINYEVIPLFHFVEGTLKISYSFPVAINIDLFGKEQRNLIVNSPVKQVQGTFFTDKIKESDILNKLELNKGKLIAFPCSWYPIKFSNQNLQSSNVINLEESIFNFWEAFKIFNIVAYNLKTNEYEDKDIWYFSDDGLEIYCYQSFKKNFPKECSLVYPLGIFLIKDINIKEETKSLFYIDLNLEEKYHTAIEPRLPRIRPFFDNHNFYPFTKFFKIKIDTPAPHNIQYLFEIDNNELKIWKNDLSDVLCSFDISSTSFWANVKKNGEDLRIIHNATNPDLGLYAYDETFFYIEKFDYANRYAKLWILVPESATELYFYYGNENASMSVANNPYRVFDFFEDFSITSFLDRTTWYYAGSECRIDSGAFIFSQETDKLWHYLRSNKIFSSNIWLEYKIGYAGDFGGEGTKWDGLRLSSLDNSDDSIDYSLKNDLGPYIGFGEGVSDWHETAAVGDGTNTFIEDMNGNTVENTTCIHEATILWTDNKIKLKKHWYDGGNINNTYEKEINSPLPTDEMFIVFGIRGTPKALRNLLVYNVRVRKYIETDLIFIFDFPVPPTPSGAISYWIEF